MLIAIHKERDALRTRLAVLDEMEASLKSAVRPAGIIVQPHAPAGALREAQLKALRGAGKITSAELKIRVRRVGHTFPINGQYFTKTLRQLVDDGLVLKDPNGSFSTYELKR